MNEDEMPDGAMMLLWAEARGWERIDLGHRKETCGRWALAPGEEIGAIICEHPPSFLATYFLGIEITHRSWMN